ncbi:FAD-dependent oxidoreductase [Roseimicrobium gellanilyticum]|nr:FAD-dependent oxidoreductase [Roseimicrobium gellanilyticum]
MKSESYWLALPGKTSYPKLTSDLKVDVLVVGGGITGVTAALLIRDTGKTVALVEKYSIGGAETGHTTAHLTYMTDTRLSDLASDFDEEHALASWDAGAHAIDQIRKLVERHQIDCEFKLVPGYLAEAANTKDREEEQDKLRQEAELAARHGFDVAYLDSIPPLGRAGIRFANQAKFHPIKYLRALAVQAANTGVQIFENSSVDSFEEEPARAVIGDYSITYDHVIIATHMPLQGNVGTLSALLLQTKLYAYSTYALEATAPFGSLPEIIWSDTAEPFNYLRVDRNAEGDVIVYGGKDHKTGQEPDTEKCYNELTRDLMALVPDAKVNHRWSGQVIETLDGLPFIGEAGDGQFLATGFSGNGLTFGTLAAMMASDYASGKKNPWTELFDPHRKALTSAWDYAKENASYPYYMARDWAKGTEAGDVNALPCHAGKIIRHHGKRVAAYRNEDGEVTLLSPVCPHLGCIVHWNDAEQTWDCPCHGSRFSGDGKVMSGPAEKDLSEIEE